MTSPRDEPVHLLLRAGINSLAPEHIRRQAVRAADLLGFAGISAVGVWQGEGFDSIWASEPNLRDRRAVWVARRTTLEANGFAVVKTLSDERHFTIVLPSMSIETLTRLQSLMTIHQR